ncbi:MAG TPA: argininosuccinate lyase [Vicinamibacterales bacterium]|nr:argininosuccinate lyase [Vicinamibacterales bacterium]
MKFSPEYVRLVLNENFEDAKAQFLVPLMAIEYAHLVMLADQEIVSRSDAAAIRRALDGISLDEIRKVQYDGTYEDLFFYIERLVVAGCGEDAAGRLHTARSRNDIDMTMYRMSQRQLMLAVIEGTLDLRRALIPLADRYREAVFAAHTHTQPAQVSTVAHYLQAVIEQLERDAVRLKAAYASTNQNPLGACAITGTGFPIDRDRTAALLGFDGTTCNTYGSIATVDYLLESVGAAATMLVGLGRVVQDLLLWSTIEFGYLRLADGFVQGSSIMPQKRNPVALEHARAIGSKALGQAAGLMLATHNTPFGDIVDTEDDLQPLVAQMFKDAARAVSLVAAAMAEAAFDVAKLAERAGQNWITITELADTLAREHGLPFKAGHAVAARLIAGSRTSPDTPMATLLRQVSKDVTGKEIVYSEEQLAALLSPQYFVEVRKTYGGPAPSETARATGVSRQALAADEQWVSAARDRLRSAEEALKKAAATL